MVGGLGRLDDQALPRAGSRSEGARQHGVASSHRGPGALRTGPTPFLRRGTCANTELVARSVKLFEPRAGTHNRASKGRYCCGQLHRPG